MEDRAAVGLVVDAYFGAFASGPGLAERMQKLRELFLPGAVIVRTCGQAPLLYDVEGFIAPRAELLAEGGALSGFSEWETGGRTDLFGDVAQRFCSYQKAGLQDGVPFTGSGMKSIQLVRTGEGWRISGVVWDDDPATKDDPAPEDDSATKKRP